MQRDHLIYAPPNFGVPANEIKASRPREHKAVGRPAKDSLMGILQEVGVGNVYYKSYQGRFLASSPRP